MTKQKTTKMITINIPIKLHNEAKKSGINMSEVTRKAITIAIENQLKTTNILKVKL